MKNWRSDLDESVKDSLDEREERKIILNNFKKFWDTKPTEEECGKYTDGMRAYFEIIYHVANNPIQKCCVIGRLIGKIRKLFGGG